MALIVDQQQPQHKHYCRICKKGFGCGRALGNDHMRVHGISDDISNMDDDNEDHTNYDWAPNSSKAMYTLCTNPNKLKSCRVCKNCSTEFSSWKSFLEHGKCITNETDSDVGDSFPGSDHEEGLPRGSYEHNWSKRKRSYRAKDGSNINPNFPSSEEDNLALCLLMLSSGTSESFFVTGTKESCPSASRDGGRKHHLSPYNQSNNSSTQYHEKAKLVIPRRLFECKACKKVFSSHQSLGGHRASHKKVKGCFAAKLDHTDENEEDQAHGMITQDKLYFTKLQDDNNGSYNVKKKAKLHECSICYRVFSSGQALGGHKRCHWITSKNSLDHASRSVVKFNNNQLYDQATGAVNDFPKDSETLDLTLDLNFHDLDAKPQNNQIYTAKEKVEKITEDETVTKTKFAKLIELKEMNSCETSSRWLQVGLGSTSSQAGSDP